MHLLGIQSGFIILTISSYSYLFLEIKKAVRLGPWPLARKGQFTTLFLVALLAWGLFVTFWSLSGWMGNFLVFPFNVLPILTIPFISILVFSFSKTMNDLLLIIPNQKIVQLQTFRFFVELLLWAMYLKNQVPIQMTFEGQNFDVLTGASAPIIALLIAKGKISKTSQVIWNILCLALLVNIVVTAILSMPSPLKIFIDEPANTIVTLFPFSWLPGLLVPLAYGLHFLSLRQLYLTREKMLK